MSGFEWLSDRVDKLLKNKGTEQESPWVLGPLEFSAMQALWAHGQGTVRDVIQALDRPLAYTTVMTTLDRLYKKGLLDRRKTVRAFLYSPRMSRLEWEQKRVVNFVNDLLSIMPSSRELLVSRFVEAVGEQDETLLEELEQSIRTRRSELDRTKKP
jgi:predicted transcriptional regulator